MSNKKDLTGQKFGKLTVLGLAYTNKWRNTYWNCKCDCTKEKVVRGSHLKSGVTKSCGCLKKEVASKLNFKDLTEQRFGKLVAKKVVGKDKQGKSLWLCRCDCTKEKVVRASSLISGNTSSCGCLQKERVFETTFKDLTGQKFGKLTVLEFVGRSKWNAALWRCQCSCKNFYVVAGYSLTNGHTKSCGCYHGERMTELHSGVNSHFWINGRTPLNHKIRNSTLMKKWKTAIFKRDNYTCQVSGKEGGVQAHHIRPFAQIVEENNITTFKEALKCKELWNTSNGITLAKELHSFTSKNPSSFHREYGTITTEEDFYKWFNKTKEELGTI